MTPAPVGDVQNITCGTYVKILIFLRERLIVDRSCEKLRELLFAFIRGFES